ncbi:MAG TPA: pseudouridine-5'-phosphate glycosidase [Candidatus Limnocylindrales bacterium]|nr:pseudouridine-5'-phosphate glycosidase [Candidatus Limnocylindrales bacterium]
MTTGLGTVRDRLETAPEVAAALADGRPVVALESTLISHGLDYPFNLEVASASEAAVRESGAIPATVAIQDGRIRVGLDDAALEALATAPRGTVMKAARPSLGVAVARRGWAATTISATLIAAHAAGIRVFGTGGIGGVHPAAAGRAASFDISSDLDELARTPIAVVCSGPKAILDVANTLEVLETRGVPVVALGQRELPGFYARSAGFDAPHTVPDVAAAAELIDVHVGLGLGCGLLLCVPVPADVALPEAVARDAVRRANADADAAGIHGPDLTPWLLARIATITDGASVRANTALIVNNARTAGQIAVALVARAAGRR